MIASIEHHGLLQSLVVRQAKRGKYAVIAGGRRLRAMLALAEAGKLASDFEVPCFVIADAGDAAELSLAENTVRAPMHPADQFEAFRIVIDQGKSVADVAARFNVTEQLVSQRLKLGRLAPSILQAYREEAIDLEEAQAFTLTDDHAEQERVFAELGQDYRDAWRIRQALTKDEIPATDKRARCVGVETYEAAGGIVRRDLFQASDHCYLQDAVLLDKLVYEKLTEAAETAKAEGWSWVTVDADADYGTLSKFDRHYPKRKSLSKKDRAQLGKLTRQYDAIVEKLEDDEDAAANARLDKLQQRIDKLSPPAVWPAKTLAACGAIVTLGYNGEIAIERGLAKPAATRKQKAAAKAAEAKANGEAGDAIFSAKLTEDLTVYKTAAIRAELAKQPDVAFRAVIHAMALQVWYRGYRVASSLEIQVNAKTLRTGEAECKAIASLEAERELWGERLPGDSADLWSWCLEQDESTLRELLAYFAACSVNGVQQKHDRPNAPHLQHADMLASALKLDMTTWFTPTAENFFGKISRKAILALVDEAKGAPMGPGLEKLNKADLASRAAQIVQGTGWLPAPLRTAGNDNAAAEAAYREAAE
jgi:ParB family chromosome partitioning protein